VVAKIRGACLGGGFALSLSCDLAYASEDSFFGEPEVKFGGSTMSPLLAWALPPRHFKELLLTGRRLDAKRAEAWGLINEAVSADALDARVDQVVRHMCLLPPGTLTRNKSLLNRFYDVMGYATLLDIAQDRSVMGLSAAPANEFTRISKEQGVSAALAWQKKRFAEVGAFDYGSPEVSLSGSARVAAAYRKAARFGAWLLSAILLVCFWQWYTTKFDVSPAIFPSPLEVWQIAMGESRRWNLPERSRW
jgi:hypothetical protein